MHQGQIPGPPGLPISQPASGSIVQQSNLSQPPNAPPQNTQQPQVTETSLDDLISGASKQAEKVLEAAGAATEIPTAGDQPSDKPSDTNADEPAEEKKDKKEKTKASHLVYSDQDTSPEEKMAKMARYAFIPEKAR
jgi:hypothetical protein